MGGGCYSRASHCSVTHLTEQLPRSDQQLFLGFRLAHVQASLFATALYVVKNSQLAKY